MSKVSFVFFIGFFPPSRKDQDKIVHGIFGAKEGDIQGLVPVFPHYSSLPAKMAGGNAEAMRITMIVCTVVTLIFMTLRFYCKQYLGTKLAVDDFVLAFSWVGVDQRIQDLPSNYFR